MTPKNENSINKKTHLINSIALALALLFHISGIIGILFSAYKDWFIKATFFNLVLMAILLVITHPVKTKNIYIFYFAALIAGFIAEVIGVNTNLLFGSYTYGDVLGFKLFNVPVIIGINWFIIIYCAGMVTQSYEHFMLRKINERGLDINNRMKVISFIIDASFLIVLFDWIMEPAAVKLGYWQWNNGAIPQYNYVSWVLVSVLLLALFRRLNQNARNIFAVHLFIIQLLFFLVLRTFL